MVKQSLLFVGDAGIDYYSDSSMHLPGGCSLNSIIHFNLLDNENNFSLKLFAPLGDDDYSKKLIKFLDSLSLNNLASSRRGNTPIQMIRNDQRGEKVFENYQAGILETIDFNQNEIEAFSLHTDYLIMPCFSQIQKFNNDILERSNPKRIVLDFLDGNDFSKNIEKMRPFLDKAWLSFIGLSLDDDNLIENLKSYSIEFKKNIIISLGKDGALLLREGDVYHQKVNEIENVIDSTGAGDSLIGSFLYYYLSSNNWEKSLKDACAYAGKNLLFKGALPKKISDIF